MVGLVVGVLLVAGLAGLVLDLVVWRRLVSDFDVALAGKARVMAQTVKRDKAGRVEVEFAEEIAREFARDRHKPEYFEVWDAEGRVIERSPSLKAKDLDRRDAVDWVTLPDGHDGRAVGVTFAPEVDEELQGVEEGTGPPVTLVLARRTSSIEDTMEVVGWGLAVAAAVMSVGAGAMVWTMVGRGLGPLRKLGEEAGRIDAANLSARFGEDVPDELKTIVLRLNELLARLQASFDRERRFTSAAAHELRTPIAEIKAMAEVAVKWPDGDHRRLAGEVLAVARNMEHLAGGLLTLSRSEAGEKIAGSPLDLRQTVDKVVESIGVGNVQVIGQGQAVGDAVMVEAVARNLIENALVHGGPGDVECRLEDGRLIVRNPKGELEPGDVSRMFEPFWRKDKARTGGKHAGLGLALVTAYVGAMGGNVTAGIDGDVFWIGIELMKSRAAVAGGTSVLRMML